MGLRFGGRGRVFLFLPVVGQVCGGAFPVQVEQAFRGGDGGRFRRKVDIPHELGKIIGKQGRTARAIRTILGAVSAKTKKRVVLEILE